MAPPPGSLRGVQKFVRGSGMFAVRTATVQTLRPHFERVLKPQERRLLEMRYCEPAEPRQAPTLEAIAEQLEVSRSRAAQIEKTALQRLGISVSSRAPHCRCGHAYVAHRRRRECLVPGCDDACEEFTPADEGRRR